MAAVGSTTPFASVGQIPSAASRAEAVRCVVMRGTWCTTTAVACALAFAGCGASDGSGDGEGGSSDGDLRLGGEIPDYVPDDLYLPDAMTIEGVSRTGEMISIVGTFESGDVETVHADMVAGMEAAGYELLSNDDLAAFVKDGVGRVRVRTAEFLDELTVTIDIDTWSDEQLDELRALFAEEIVVPGRASAQIDDETFEAVGECTLQGKKRAFFAGDGSITIQIDETIDPPLVSADVTTSDGRIYYTESGVQYAFGSAPEALTASGEMLDDAGGPDVIFTVEATCDS